MPSRTLVVETASMVVKCPPHATVQEREQFIQEKVHEAVSQRVQELHENPENGQVKVEVLPPSTPSTSTDSDAMGARTDSYNTALAI
eukprot:m.429924 g.429924  ORF g.429924 m.429924 type:complete len:87 (+) comp17091_c0_seq1:90-350(+)